MCSGMSWYDSNGAGSRRAASSRQRRNKRQRMGTRVEGQKKARSRVHDAGMGSRRGLGWARDCEVWRTGTGSGLERLLAPVWLLLGLGNATGVMQDADLDADLNDHNLRDGRERTACTRQHRHAHAAFSSQHETRGSTPAPAAPGKHLRPRRLCGSASLQGMLSCTKFGRPIMLPAPARCCGADAFLVPVAVELTTIRPSSSTRLCPVPTHRSAAPTAGSMTSGTLP